MRLCISFIFLGLPLFSCALQNNSNQYSDDFKKGFSVFFMPPRNEFDSADFTEHLLWMKSDGVNALFLSPMRFMSSFQADTIISTSATLSDSSLCKAISLAQESGFNVILKPHVNCMDDKPRYTIKPLNYDKWFLSYREFILHYFTIAKSFNQKYFVIGTELDNVAEHDRFISLCDSLCKSTDMQIIFAGSYNHFINTRLWNHIDIMGINAYFNLDNAEPPSPFVINETWNYWLNLIDRYSHTHDKPVMITEAGYMSRPDAARNSGDFSGTPVSDMTVQSQCYEALLSQAGNFSSIKGLFFWQWELGEKGRTDTSDYTPRGKTAEEIVRKYWNGDIIK